MKKIIGIVVCLALALGAGWYYFAQRAGSAVGQYGRYLPQNTLLTASLTRINTLTDTFAASPLGRFLAKETIRAILEELKAEPQSISEYERLHDQVATVATNPAFRAVFGDDAVVAVLPPDGAALAGEPAAALEALRQSLVVLATTTAPEALESFGRVVMSGAVTRETIDGLEVTKIAVDQGQVIYGHAHQGTVLLAYSPKAIKTCMATRQGETSLAQSPAFKAAELFWQPVPLEQTFSRVFVNTLALAPLLSASSDPELKQAGELMAGVDYAASLTRETGQGLESLARSGYRHEALHELVKGAIASSAKSNQSLHLLQGQSLAYNWSSSLRPEVILSSLATENKEDYRQADAAVRETLDLSLEELGRTFGPQYGGVLNAIVNAGLFPVPKMVFFLEVRDRKVAEKALAGLRRQIAALGIAGEEEEVIGGHTVYSWPVLPGEATQPAVTLTDSMLYLANDRKALEAFLTNKEPADRLVAPVAEQLGADLATRVSGANFGSLVLYPARMASQVSDVVDWLNGLMASTKNISATRLSREVMQVLNSTEYLTATSNLAQDHADWTLTLRRMSPPATEKTAK